jgi:hypothetical protein
MTHFRTPALNGEHTDNVIAFPRPRLRAAAPALAQPSLHGARRPAAVAGAELNARLLILLCICTTSATIVLSAVHILHG